MTTPRTSFIGRDAEVQRVAELLRETRMLTLVGPGGIGKSRLALQAAAQVSDAAALAFADIGSLDRGSRVAVRVAELFGIGEPEDGSPIVAAVAAALPDGDVLLLLDGCEHVVDDVASFADGLLDAAPGVRMLATSQRPLGIAGEVVWAVPPLTEGDATMLFAARAAAADPDRSFSPDETAALTGLCRSLDGLPLAIELAAARTRSLTVGEIAAGLGRRFELLVSGSRSADSRHTTLRASLDWSYDLLASHQRETLQRLSLFVSGFDAESAVAMAAPATREDLSELVDRSLVSFDPRVEPGWYRLSDTARAYAQQRLEASGDAPAARAAFVRHFLGVVEQAVPLLDGPEQSRWMRRLALEQDNISAALAWSPESGAEEALGRLAGAMATFWLESSQWTECRVWLEAALAAPALSPGVRARLLEGLCHLGTWTGDLASVAARAGELIETASEAGDKWYIGRGLGYRAVGTALAHGAEAAREDFEDARRLSIEGGDVWGFANLAWAFCFARMFQGDPDEPRTLLGEAIALSAGAGDARTERHTTALAALLAVTHGRLDDAHRLGSRIHPDAREAKQWSGALLALTADAWQFVLRGESERGAALAADAVAIAEAADEDPLFLMLALTVQGLALHAMDDPDGADAALARAVRAAREGQLPRWAALPLVFRGVLLGDDAAMTEGAALAEEHDFPWIHAHALLARARRLRWVDATAAEGFAYDALRRHSEAGNAIGVCDALDEVASHRARRGHPGVARRLVLAAAAERARIGAQPGVAVEHDPAWGDGEPDAGIAVDALEPVDPAVVEGAALDEVVRSRCGHVLRTSPRAMDGRVSRPPRSRSPSSSPSISPTPRSPSGSSCRSRP